ncbi:HAD-IA family hydrolase [Actinocorallia lasiicapitis]
MNETPAAPGRSGLILDFGGVLTTDFFGTLRAFCAAEGLAPDAVERLVRTDPRAKQAVADAECGRIAQREFDSILGEGLGLPAAGLSGRMTAALLPSVPMLDLAERARAAGIATAVLSNYWGAGPDAHDIHAGYELDQRFDVVVISHLIGVRKPEEPVYRLVLDKLGVAAEDCVFVDDNRSHLPPAEALGMSALLFTDPVLDLPELERLLGLG